MPAVNPMRNVTRDLHETIEIPLVPGQNLHNWWFGYRDGEEGRLVPWLSRNTVDGRPAYRYWRVWEWQNPRPKEKLRSLSIIVKEVKNAYQQTVLVGLSGTRW